MHRYFFSSLLAFSLMLSPLTGQGDPPEEEEMGESFLPQTPGTASGAASEPQREDFALRTEQALKEKSFQEARGLAEEFVRRMPSSPAGHRLLAMALYGLGDHEKAYQSAREGLRLAPQDEGLKALEKLLGRRFRTPLDVSSLEAAVKSLGDQEAREAGLPRMDAPEKSSVRTGAGAEPPASGHPPEADPVKEAVRSLNLDDPHSAVRLLTYAIESDPRRGLAYRLRALARTKLGDSRGAYEDATQALVLHPNDSRSLHLQGLALLGLNRHEDAAAAADRALALDPKDSNAYRIRALAREQMGQLDLMLEDLRTAAALDPQMEELYRQARARHRRGWPLPDGMHPAPATLGWTVGALALALFLLGTVLAWRNLGAGETGLRPGSENRQPAGTALRLQASPNGVAGFEILGKLGEGGMGVVYEAFDRTLRRKVALKRMRQELLDVPKARRRFLKEARTVASLRHPHIVAIHSVLEQADGLYLVFEFVPGGTVHDLLRRRGFLPLPQALGLLGQVGQALDHAHSLGVVHRDLKPSNIMVTGEGEAKVMDFGIARQMLDTLSRLTRGELLGTPAYMAPEQERGESRKESDLYALAVTFYEMVAGENPFRGLELHYQKMGRLYRPLSQAVPSLPSAIDEVLARALDPVPDLRFGSSAQFLAALQALRA